MNERNRDLRDRTKRFARTLIQMFVKLPNKPAAQILGKQALRAGTSIGANYREASRARSRLEFIAKVGDCLKEADETEYWLELLADEAFLSPQDAAPLLDESRQLIAILTTIVRKAKDE